MFYSESYLEIQVFPEEWWYVIDLKYQGFPLTQFTRGMVKGWRTVTLVLTLEQKLEN